MFVLDKKVIVYKVTYRVRAQLCEEKNVQKEILLGMWPLDRQW